MKSPTELVGPRVQLFDNDEYLWERTEEKLDSRGLAEGPEVLQHNGRTFVSYSTGASWLPTYKLGLLELTGDDPMNQSIGRSTILRVFSPQIRFTESATLASSNCQVRSRVGGTFIMPS